MDEHGNFEDLGIFRKKLRNSPTESEFILWSCLRKSGIGFKFTRQYRIGRYFADFCSRQRRLVVELDGESHERRAEEDEARDRYMIEAGYVVLRFHNEVVDSKLEYVLAKIATTCEARPRWRY